MHCAIRPSIPGQIRSDVVKLPRFENSDGVRFVALKKLKKTISQNIIQVE